MWKFTDNVHIVLYTDFFLPWADYWHSKDIQKIIKIIY